MTENEVCEKDLVTFHKIYTVCVRNWQ